MAMELRHLRYFVSPILKLFLSRLDELVGRNQRKKPGRGADDPCSLAHHHAIDIAPLPVLARFDRPHDRMAGGVEVLRRVPIFRTVATGDVSAVEAHAQVDPSVAGPHTL